jgi:hypothetical protein
MDFKERGGEEVKCILLAQDRENFLFHKVRRIFWTTDDQETLCYKEFVTNVRPTKYTCIPCTLPLEALLGMQVYKHYLWMSKTTNIILIRRSKRGKIKKSVYIMRHYLVPFLISRTQHEEGELPKVVVKKLSSHINLHNPKIQISTNSSTSIIFK